MVIPPFVANIVKRDDTIVQYISLSICLSICSRFLSGPPSESDSSTSEAVSEESKFTEIVTTIQDGVYTIKKNRPHKKNAITWKVGDF